jgi:ERO1-like protein beta
MYIKRHRLPGCYYRDSDFCFLDDNTSKGFPIARLSALLMPPPIGGEYFDLTLIPERYTGYSGPDAHRIWRAIYEENCFGLSELMLMKGPNPAPVSLPDTLTDVIREEDPNDVCLEKRVYYKVISGLHASISTHICAEWMNQTTGEWVSFRLEYLAR